MYPSSDQGLPEPARHEPMGSQPAGRESFEYDLQYHPELNESRQSAVVLPESAG